MNSAMKRSLARILFFLLYVTAGGCQTVAVEHRSTAQTRQGITAVAGGLSGRPLSNEEARRLEAQIRKDPEAQEAVSRIATSMSEAPKAKYCPVGGEHYAPNLEVCPIHKVRLLTIDN